MSITDTKLQSNMVFRHCDWNEVEGSNLINPELLQQNANWYELLTQYRSVPISFADASLVRMAEQYPGSEILTTLTPYHIPRELES